MSHRVGSAMQAYVYRSRRKADTYLYLREKDAFALVPEPLQAQLGVLEFVLEVVLEPGRRLARADADVVRADLIERGFYLQLPPPPGGVPTDG
ncbi:YcgL domain-containing protein [Coralloluteibacterium thermophilus]|uniref:YcgL domain-containing protein ACFO3Q_00335 n=1 Tax=Coralloluteibacterium thermophilum TaxID=2707049 RepID=A0ABV9NGN5_9GAMM